MAVRYDRNRKSWLVEFEQAGVRVYQRLPKGCTRAQGEAREAQLRREIYDRETLEKVPVLTLQDAIDQWLREDHRRKDRRKAQSEARQWEPFVGGRLLREAPEVAGSAIEQWQSGKRSVPKPQDGMRSKSTTRTGANGMTSTDSATIRREGHGSRAPNTNGTEHPNAKNVSAATINRRLAMLKAVCRHAYKQGRIPDNLSGRITMLKEDNKRETYLTRPQVLSLMKHSPSGDCRAAIAIAAYTGLRASELLALDATTPQSDTLSVRQSKNGKPRVIPAPKLLRPYLSALPLALDYWQLHKQFLEACKKAKLKGLRFHDLRHTCASWLINEGVDIYTVSKILGHSSIATTQRYAHLYHSTLQDAMSRLK